MENDQTEHAKTASSRRMAEIQVRRPLEVVANPVSDCLLTFSTEYRAGGRDDCDHVNIAV